MWLSFAGVKPLPEVAWQLVQLVAPVWFIVAGVQVVPMAWQDPQLLLVSGDTLCGLAPLVGRPVAAVLLWQPVKQSLLLVTPLWVPVAGSQAVVRWQDAHCWLPMAIWLALAGVKPLPAVTWQLVQLTAPV